MPAKRTLLVTSLLALSIVAQVACTGLRRGSAPATSSAKRTELIDQIFARYTEAVGGEAAINSVNTYKTSGSFETSVARVRGTFEVWGKSPNKSLSIIDFPQLGALRRGFDGETGWVQTPAGTFTLQGVKEMAEIERDAEVYRAGKIKDLYYELKLDNNARLSGRDVYVVEGKPLKGPAEKLFFDKENGLLVRWDMVRRNPQRGNVFVKVHLDEYREVDGLKVPFKVRLAFESFDFTMKIDQLQHNVSIDDAVFKQPGRK